MKADFKNINEKHIVPGSVFYLYGNYKKTFDVFCDFMCGKFQEKSLNVSMHFCSINDCADIISNGYDLFEEKFYCLCIRNVEDKHIEKLSPFLNVSNNIFILESGDYVKSKKITDYFLKSDGVFSIASFKNDITLHSLCRMFFENFSPTTYDKIVKIINETDEELLSIFRKLSILVEKNTLDLEKYITYKKLFVSELELISLIRYLSQSYIKEKILNKNQSDETAKSQNENLISLLLDAEMKQKTGQEITKSYIGSLQMPM
jgi:hypothetical protein